MRGLRIRVLVSAMTIPLWLMGCPGTLDHAGGDDDDVADDDASDDDASDDDASDDDASDDDASDDAASDDDASDDDASDDDASDDDASDDDATDDDDDTQPPPLGVEFDAVGGPLAGYHSLSGDVWCGWDGSWVIYGGNGNWIDWIGLYLDYEPGAGDHFAQDLYIYGEIDVVDFEKEHGGADCYLDVISDNPVWGTFECDDVTAWDYNSVYTMDLVNGRFRCP